MIRKYVFKYLKLYVIWSIIYFPLSLSTVINKNISASEKFITLIKNFLFVSSYQHLWYLRAGFIALLIILILLALKMSAKKMLILSGVLYFVGLFEYSYKIILKPIEAKMPKFVEAINNIDDFFVTTRNGLFFAFFFICLGMFFAWYSMKLSFPKIGFVVFLALMVFEAYFERKFELVDRYDKFLFLPIVITFMFYLALNVKIKFKYAYVLLRRLSMWIYFIHIYILKLFYYCILILFKNEPGCLSQFIVTVLGSTIAALIIYKLSKKNKFRFINYLC